MQTLLLGLGVASAILGGIACLRQRHLKRLLAFSTISHAGILLIGLALVSPTGLGGMLAYFLGHGLIKGALFMIAGILLAKIGGIDEIGLRGCGRSILPAGIAMKVGGLLLGGAPIGLLDEGARLIDTAAAERSADWIAAAVGLGTACTGGAVLRATGRIFLGWGPLPGEEARGPSEEDREKADRPLWLMMIPVSELLLAAVGATGHYIGESSVRAAARFIAWDGTVSVGPVGAPVVVAIGKPPHPFMPWMTVCASILIAAHDLARARLPRWWLAASDRVLGNPLSAAVDRIHDGVVGDYVVWILVGLALFSLGSIAALR